MGSGITIASGGSISQTSLTAGANFFLKDAKVVRFLKENGMTKWTWTKTDELEPERVVALMEYKNKKSFDDCQKIFSKYMPNVRGLVYKSNIIRGNVIFEKI